MGRSGGEEEEERGEVKERHGRVEEIEEGRMSRGERKRR